MRRALCVALVTFSGSLGLAQQGDAEKPQGSDPQQEETPERPARPGDKDWKGGRWERKREQGSAAELKARVEGLLAALARRRAGGEAEDSGLAPPKAPDGSAGPQDAASLLRSFAPDEAAVRDAFLPRGKEVARKLLSSAKRLFEGEVTEIAKRLKIRPEHETVEVYAASTEELIGMELGTVAGREFAGALRRTASLLRPNYRWYAVVLRPKGEAAEDAEDDATDWDLPKPRDGDEVTRLQVFFRHKDRYVLLGKVWKLDGVE